MTSQEKCDIHFSTGLGPKPGLSEEEDLDQFPGLTEQVVPLGET
jgi:hypothetical protein